MSLLSDTHTSSSHSRGVYGQSRPTYHWQILCGLRQAFNLLHWNSISSIGIPPCINPWPPTLIPNFHDVRVLKVIDGRRPSLYVGVGNLNLFLGVMSSPVVSTAQKITCVWQVEGTDHLLCKFAMQKRSK